MDNSDFDFMMPSKEFAIINSLEKTEPEQRNPRDYDKLMDEHALHVFMVRNGESLQETPEFESFKRVYQLMWAEIIPYLDGLESYCKMLKIKMLKVNGSALVNLVRRKMQPSALNLIECVLPFDFDENSDQKFDHISFAYKLKVIAVVRIQAQARRILAMTKARKLRVVMRKIKLIQAHMRVFLMKKRTKLSVLEKNVEKYLQFEELQAKL